MNPAWTALKIKEFDTNMRSWKHRVTRQKSLLDAAREAQHPPQPVSWLRSLVRQGAHAADVERHLVNLVETCDLTDTDIPQILRMLQGRWPNAARRLLNRVHGR